MNRLTHLIVKLRRCPVKYAIYSFYKSTLGFANDCCHFNDFFSLKSKQDIIFNFVGTLTVVTYQEQCLIQDDTFQTNTTFQRLSFLCWSTLLFILVRAACVRCHGTKCQLLAAFFSLTNKLRFHSKNKFPQPYIIFGLKKGPAEFGWR